MAVVSVEAFFLLLSPPQCERAVNTYGPVFWRCCCRRLRGESLTLGQSNFGMDTLL